MTESSLDLPLPEMEESRFRAPWEARIFSLVTELQRTGLIDRRRWMDVFAHHRQRLAVDGMADERIYYHAWLAACEDVLVEAGNVTSQDISSARDDAIRNWPPHDHVAHREPITVSAALT